MINVEKLVTMVRLVLLSAYLKNEKPVSLMIVSDRPESGKTEIIKKFDGNRKIAMVTDATAFGIWRDFHEQLSNGDINHLLFPDFLTLVSRQKTTVDALITTLNPLIEEGLASLHTGFLKPLSIAAPRPIGIILAMIKEPLDKYKKEWMSNGFLSRLLIFTYKYSDDTVRAIFKSILDEEYIDEKPSIIRFPDGIKPVHCSLAMGAALTLLMRKLPVQKQLFEDRRSYGFRMIKNLRRLAKANALYCGRNEVEQKDIDVIAEVSEYMNEEYRELK